MFTKYDAYQLKMLDRYIPECEECMEEVNYSDDNDKMYWFNNHTLICEECLQDIGTLEEMLCYIAEIDAKKEFIEFIGAEYVFELLDAYSYANYRITVNEKLEKIARKFVLEETADWLDWCEKNEIF